MKKIFQLLFLILIISGCQLISNPRQSDIENNRETTKIFSTETVISGLENVKETNYLDEQINISDPVFEFISNNNGCSFPCILGINIEEVNITDAISIVLDKYPNETILASPYYDDASGNEIYSGSIDSYVDDLIISYTIKFVSKNDEISNIESKIQVINNGYIEPLDKFFPIYSVKNILLDLGEPDYIYIGPIDKSENKQNTYFLHLYYLTEKIVFEFNLQGDSKSMDICLDSNSKNLISLSIFVYSSEDGVNHRLEEIMNNEYSSTLDEVTNETAEKIITGLRDFDSYCITIEK